MQKKTTILIIVIVLFLVGGGVYWWGQSGAELRELNKNLPEGIRVVERGGQQVIVNEIDGYEIKVPEEWKGLKKMDYTEAKEEAILSIEGNRFQIATITSHNIDENTDIHSWIKSWFQASDIFVEPQIIGEELIGDYTLLKVKDFGGVMGDIFFYYLKKGSRIYEFVSDSEEAIQDVILNINF